MVPNSVEMRVLSESFAVLSPFEIKTFPSDNPDRTLDYILVYRGGAGKSFLKKLEKEEGPNDWDDSNATVGTKPYDGYPTAEQYFAQFSYAMAKNKKLRDAIRAQISPLPAAEKLIALLREIGCPCTPQEIGVDAPVLRDTFLYAKETRARYTLFQLVADLGLAGTLADRVIARVFS